MRRHRKRQAHIHPARITLDRGINELLDLGKSHDLIQLAANFLPGHAQDRAIQVDILAPGQVRVKAGAHFQQAGDASLHPHMAAGGSRHTAEGF